MKKRVSFCLFIIITVCFMTSCGGAQFDGADELKRAKKLFEEMNSARITVSDNIGGTMSQSFAFSYDAADTLIYAYSADSGDGDMYYEYHNGSEIVKTTDSAGEWTAVAEGSENYYSYSRSVRSSYTSASLLAFFDSCVSQSSVTENESGGKTIRLSYDLDALNALGLLSAEVGTLEAFEEEISLDADGSCVRLTQSGASVSDGASSDYSYTIIIEEINAAEKTVRPVPKWEISAS